MVSRSIIETYDGSETRLGLFVDVETTGLDPTRDEIVELAMVPFTYGVNGRIFEIHQSFDGLRESSQPLSPKITALTGITNDIVAGLFIDATEVRKNVTQYRRSVANYRKLVATY